MQLLSVLFAIIIHFLYYYSCAADFCTFSVFYLLFFSFIFNTMINHA